MIRFQAEGEATPPPREQRRADDTGDQRRKCDEDKGDHVTAQVVADLLRGDPDAHEPDDLGGVRGEDRHLGADRFAQRSTVGGQVLTTAECTARIGTEGAGQFGCVGVRKPQSTIVGDDHEESTGAVGNGDCLGLERSVGQGVLVERVAAARSHLGAHLIVGRHRSGDGEGTLAVLLTEFVVAAGDHDAEADTETDQDHHHLQEQDLVSQPHEHSVGTRHPTGAHVACQQFGDRVVDQMGMAPTRVPTTSIATETAAARHSTFLW